MSQSGAHDKVKLEKDPSPEGEGGFFSSPDEKMRVLENNHALSVLDRQLGLIGRVTGSTNPSLNIAFVIAAALLAILGLCIGSVAWGAKALEPFVERVLAAILSVAGFIFGAHIGGGNKQ